MFSGNTSQVSADQLYVEDVFSTWLYTGNAGSQTITNGIDLAGKGGMVWLKSRSGSGYNHVLTDTVRGVNATLVSNSTAAQFTASTLNWAFLSSGFSINNSFTDWNANGATYASWTFREAPKFFDVVTYTGTGANRTIAHNLGVAPGCILVKRTDNIADWQVYHRSNANTEYMVLNTTAAKATGTTRWNSTTPTATEFTVGTDTTVNASGGTYVAYLFAHDTTADGVIQCGSFTTDGSGNATVNLGYEPQWMLIKRSDGASDWSIQDNMRGWTVGNSSGQNVNLLYPNGSVAENYGGTGSSDPKLTNTGFRVESYGAARTYIYIAIRRGPMKTPTLGTSVFSPVARTVGTGSVTTGFPTDMVTTTYRDAAVTGFRWTDRLRGGGYYVNSSNTAAEVNSSNTSLFTTNTGYSPQGSPNGWFYSGGSNDRLTEYAFRRAPGFFDEVCWTGNGINPTSLNHNLGVAPELIITKKRNSTSNWTTGYAFTSTTYKYFYLNDTGAANSDTYASSPVYGGNPTSSVFIVGNQGGMNISGDTYVSYLFASCPGVSKVGSYTGNGSSQTINCGFAAGARFVLIKRTDSTGDWYVWDTARGIVAGNDPHLSLNTTAAEVTTDDTIDTDSSGFVVNQVAATNVNVSSATYIYLAIA